VRRGTDGTRTAAFYGNLAHCTNYRSVIFGNFQHIGLILERCILAAGFSQRVPVEAVKCENAPVPGKAVGGLDAG
jgi:hypothetical protein